MAKIKCGKKIGYVILVVILMAAFLYRLGLSDIGGLELVIYVVFFNLALVQVLKNNKNKSEENPCRFM
ncbi:TPA: hypothetical protein U2D36_000207 [Streptococcus suis]|uniref:hypothetical protein n=1 Tax=Streptococcus suis TaxID=1307 RepID=UPI00042189B2|nr:hypothetical protein [Streptococcus suis]HEM3198203.1 hypothetical protein [Streptococcus suis 14A]HEM6178555.1 hypothetical protein [Streptococcus suis]HEM6215041.1 hypothetical protein [Streptococcus suis]HEM6355851.1 hypothetical protein [Streptococcus suis]HEM6379909.1 hypothetical protein [Streptococcus suis]